VAAGFTLALLVTHAAAQAQPTAREHFERGYRLVEAGKLDAAIGEFERAYAQSPHFSVLYNLGQAYATLGRSAEAVDRLQRYLSLGGSAIPRQRREEVLATIAFHSARVGSVTLEVEPADARVSIDGAALDAGALSQPLRLDAGVHGVLAEHPRFATRGTSIHVDAERTTHVVIRLEPLPPAQLELHCQLPDVTLSVDGVAAHLPPPGESVAIGAGTHEVRLQRPGYRPRVQQVHVSAGQRALVPCTLEVDPSAADVAALTVRHPSGTQVLVNGAPHARRALPAGRHRVTVSGPGYEREERLVTLAARQKYETAIVPPVSSRALLEERTARARTQRTVGYVTGGVGLAATLTAGALYLYNANAYRNWRSDSVRLVDRLRTDPGSVRPRELDELLHAENRIRNRDAAAIGLGVFGLASILAASFLLLWTEVPHEPTTTSGTIEPPWFRF
jgi:hypothetical protein